MLETTTENMVETGEQTDLKSIQEDKECQDTTVFEKQDTVTKKQDIVTDSDLVKREDTESVVKDVLNDAIGEVIRREDGQNTEDKSTSNNANTEVIDLEEEDNKPKEKFGEKSKEEDDDDLMKSIDDLLGKTEAKVEEDLKKATDEKEEKTSEKEEKKSEEISSKPEQQLDYEEALAKLNSISKTARLSEETNEEKNTSIDEDKLEPIKDVEKAKKIIKRLTKQVSEEKWQINFKSCFAFLT